MSNAGTLAINGGPRAKPRPYAPRPNRYGDEELQQLREALAQGTLFYAQGGKVKEFEERFAARWGVPHCVAASSCTGAIHAALAALRVGPGDEVVTSPITDMGTLSGALLQGATPVFADVDPHTCNLTAETVAACLTPRTRAVIAVHLAGNPCDAPGIAEATRAAGVALIEDCAQSYLAAIDGRLAGTVGEIGCFSLNEFKHIACGDGGMCITADPELARRIRMATDKAYSREPGASRSPEFVATNYRMTELQGAVALAQMGKLDAICEGRARVGDALRVACEEAPGVAAPRVAPGARCTWWFFLFRVLGRTSEDDAAWFAAALTAEGVPAGAHYIERCVYTYPAVAHAAAAGGHRPACPVAEEALRTCVVVPIHESWSDADTAETAAAIRKVAEAREAGL
ncbi:MAG TPA: DegT/DnrJ/EryC1/StrS family aminotransferase [Chthonomonadales bacterium]|nr:DegT/DnrJ/EryC1/StrS family aminotransferase [Chthonomonadales bacterium]